CGRRRMKIPADAAAAAVSTAAAKSACKRKGLFKDYDDALEALTDSDEQAKSLIFISATSR
ncbi:MAG: hypothetical protein ACKO66_02285, partial [Flavobacteriales bacterium]